MKFDRWLSELCRPLTQNDVPIEVLVEHIAYKDKEMLSYDLVDKYDGRVCRANIPSYDLACAIRAERPDEANLRIVCRKDRC